MLRIRATVVKELNATVYTVFLAPRVLVASHGWLQIGPIFLVEMTEVEPFDRIAGIEWNAFEFCRFCCMARSLRSLRKIATSRHGHMARRFAPAFRALGVCEHI